MMRFASRLFGIITFGSSLLLISVSGYNRGIQVEGEVVKGEVIEKPLVQTAKDGCIVFHGKLLEITHKSPVTCHGFPSEQLLDDPVKARYFQVFIPACPTPDGYDKLSDQLNRIIASVGALNRQKSTFKHFRKRHLLHHFLQD